MNGQLKNQSSIMLEDHEESISSTLRTRSSRKSLRMQEENWKHQWLQLCLARLARKGTMERPVARLMISGLKFACISEASESTRMRMEESLPYYHEDHIAGRSDHSLQQHYNLVHIFILMPQAMNKFLQQKQRWTRNGKNWRKFRRGTCRKSETNQR